MCFTNIFNNLEF